MALLKRIAAGVVGLGVLASAAIARAEAPGVYYSWRELETTSPQCLDRANQALTGQELRDIRTDGNSIAGRNDEATAVFVCLQGQAGTTVMVIVAATNDEAAVNLREALKLAF
ncbi:MAG TPA: hypothetical protein V6D07_18295 [Trichocoleus sp.]